ncbi:MAG TPA: NUDIX hydrolase [Nitrospira sp.]|nr:NUDIX hydrolase [Nitrospira sp.]
MKFCSSCGAPVSQKIPPGDNVLRFVCEHCQAIHYHNPKIVAGCIPEWGDDILLCRRAIEPRLGFWTFPAGFMEIGESTEEAAARETKEEAQAEVEIVSLYAVLSMPHIGQVYMVFRGRLTAPEFGAGSESLEVRLFPRHAIPWEEMAFPVVANALRRYVKDAEEGRFSLHLGSVGDRMPE